MRAYTHYRISEINVRILKNRTHMQYSSHMKKDNDKSLHI